MQLASIGLDNGLALNKWQAANWTNHGQVYGYISASLGLDDFKSSDKTKTWPDSTVEYKYMYPAC